MRPRRRPVLTSGEPCGSSASALSSRPSARSANPADQAASAASTSRCERGSSAVVSAALERRGGLAEAAARARPSAGLRERRRGSVVRAHARQGEVPGAPVEIAVGQCRREGPVGRPALMPLGARVDGRARERMVELGAAVDQLHEPGRLGGRDRRELDRKRRRRPLERRQLPVAGHSEQKEQPPGLLVKSLRAAGEGPGDRIGHRNRQRAWLRRPAGPVSGELDQGERVATGHAVDALDEGLREGAEERLGRLRLEPGQRQRRQVGSVEQRRLVAACRDQHADRLREQPPHGEQQCLGRRSVQPVGVVDQ
jgi:hypothetical protein